GRGGPLRPSFTPEARTPALVSEADAVGLTKSHVTSSATCSHEHSATLRISPLLMNGLRHAETRNDSPFMR
ncbi:mCG1028296, isoform CRA_a, partial [Mus musculus]